MVRALLVPILMLAGVQAACADGTFFNGNQVYNWCQSGNASAAGYVAGLVDQAALAKSFLEVTAPPKDENDVLIDSTMHMSSVMIVGFCLPERATVGQVRDVFCAYLRATPQDRHLPAVNLFQRAMQGVWPCK